MILLKIQSFASKSIEKKSPSTQRKFHGLLNPFSREIARLDFNAAPPPKEIFHFTLFFFWQKRKKVFERNFFFKLSIYNTLPSSPFCHFISRGKMFYIEKYVVPETTSIYCKEGYKSRTSTFILRYF